MRDRNPTGLGWQTHESVTENPLGNPSKVSITGGDIRAAFSGPARSRNDFEQLDRQGALSGEETEIHGGDCTDRQRDH